MIDKIGAIILQSRKMLITRKTNVDVFFIPGGKREEGETDVETLRREVFEELGVTAPPDILQGIHGAQPRHDSGAAHKGILRRHRRYA
jgi:8-oxo-dGTP diphosphatase